MPSASSSTPASRAEPKPSPGGFGLYAHWPFCQSKCPYCDFNSHVRASVDQDRWRQALVAEIEAFAEIAPGRRLDAIFFGGGTPSLAPPETIAAVIDAARRAWRFSNDIEITLEANPGSVDVERFHGYRDAGVNRVSLGVQALRDDALRFLGRLHSVEEALTALEVAADVFPRRSFDLIYARPGQTVADWRAELAEAIALAGGHMSVYQLTIEPGTAFHGAYQRGAFELPSEDDGAALFEATQEMLTAAGMPAYEISNHAVEDAACSHNLIYWRAGEWVGVGPGAHGRLSVAGARTAFRQVRTPEAWLKRVETSGAAIAERTPLAQGDVVAEALMMGLRLVEGVDRARFAAQTGIDLGEAVDAAGLKRLIDGGFLEMDAAALRATAEGRQRLNAVLPLLLPD